MKTTLKLVTDETDLGPQSPREHERKLPDDEKEWSRHSVASTAAEPVRLFLTAEKGGLLGLEDCGVTSHQPQAERIRDRFFGYVGLTQNEARWLLRVLPEALHYAEKENNK